jgi:hypothetical protein
MLTDPFSAFEQPMIDLATQQGAIDEDQMPHRERLEPFRTLG